MNNASAGAMGGSLGSGSEVGRPGTAGTGLGTRPPPSLQQPPTAITDNNSDEIGSSSAGPVPVLVLPGAAGDFAISSYGPASASSSSTGPRRPAPPPVLPTRPGTTTMGIAPPPAFAPPTTTTTTTTGGSQLPFSPNGPAGLGLLTTRPPPAALLERRPVGNFPAAPTMPSTASSKPRPPPQALIGPSNPPNTANPNPPPPSIIGPQPPSNNPQVPVALPRAPRKRKSSTTAPSNNTAPAVQLGGHGDRRVAVPSIPFGERSTELDAGLRNLMVFYEAAKKQIAAWGPGAIWHIDLVLDPPDGASSQPSSSSAPAIPSGPLPTNAQQQQQPQHAAQTPATPPPDPPLYPTAKYTKSYPPVAIPLGPEERFPLTQPKLSDPPSTSAQIHAFSIPLQSSLWTPREQNMEDLSQPQIFEGKREEVVPPAVVRGPVRGEEMLAFVQGEVRRLEAELEVSRTRSLANDAHHIADKAVLIQRLHMYTLRCAQLEHQLRISEAKRAMGIRGGPVVIRDPVPGAFAKGEGGRSGLRVLSEVAEAFESDDESEGEVGGYGWEAGVESSSEEERERARERTGRGRITMLDNTDGASVGSSADPRLAQRTRQQPSRVIRSIAPSRDEREPYFDGRSATRSVSPDNASSVGNNNNNNNIVLVEDAATVAQRLLLRAAEHNAPEAIDLEPPKKKLGRPPNPNKVPPPRKSVRKTGWAEKAGAKVLKPDLPSGLGPKKMKKTGLLAKYEREIAEQTRKLEQAPQSEQQAMREAVQGMKEKLQSLLEAGEFADEEEEEEDGEESLAGEDIMMMGEEMGTVDGEEMVVDGEERTGGRAGTPAVSVQAASTTPSVGGGADVLLPVEAMGHVSGPAPSATLMVPGQVPTAGPGGDEQTTTLVPQTGPIGPHIIYGYQGKTPPGSILRRKKKKEMRPPPEAGSRIRDMPSRAARPQFEHGTAKKTVVGGSNMDVSDSEIEEEQLQIIETDEGPGVIIEEAFGVLEFDPREVTGILTRRAEEEERAREGKAALAMQKSSSRSGRYT